MHLSVVVSCFLSFCFVYTFFQDSNHTVFVCIVKMTELKECMGRVFIDGAFEFAVPEVSTLPMYFYYIIYQHNCFFLLSSS